MKAKAVLIAALCALCGIILLQNTQVVSFQVLLWSVSMSRIIFFALLILAGFGIGYLCGRRHGE